MEEKKPWENKTSVFQSRLDIRELAGIAEIMLEHFGQHTTTASGLISLALHTLFQIGLANDWVKEDRSLREAYIYLMERGIYAINKAGRAGVDKVLGDGKKINIPIMDYIVQQEMSKLDDREKIITDIDKALGGKSKEELLNELTDSEDIVADEEE